MPVGGDAVIAGQHEGERPNLPPDEEDVDYEELWAEHDERRHLARFWGGSGDDVGPWS